MSWRVAFSRQFECRENATAPGVVIQAAQPMEETLL